MLRRMQRYILFNIKVYFLRINSHRLSFFSVSCCYFIYFFCKYFYLLYLCEVETKRMKNRNITNFKSLK